MVDDTAESSEDSTDAAGTVPEKLVKVMMIMRSSSGSPSTTANVAGSGSGNSSARCSRQRQRRSSRRGDARQTVVQEQYPTPRRSRIGMLQRSAVGERSGRQTRRKQQRGCRLRKWRAQHFDPPPDARNVQVLGRFFLRSPG